MKKSRLFRQFHDHGHLFQDRLIIILLMGPHTAGTILDAVFQISKFAAAPITQRIEGAVAKQTVKSLRVYSTVAGEIFTFFVLKKSVVIHKILLKTVPGVLIRRFQPEFHFLAGSRVVKYQPGGPEGDITLVLSVSIFPVSHQGPAAAGKLHPDLMGSSCFQPDPYFRKLTVSIKNLIA